MVFSLVAITSVYLQLPSLTSVLWAVYVVLRAGSRLFVIKMAGSVYSVPVSENVKAGRAEIVEYFVMISIKPG